jgi:hypothetical protein
VKNNDDEIHTVSVYVQTSGETDIFDRTVTLEPHEERTYEEVFSEPTEEAVVYHATVELASGETAERTFTIRSWSAFYRLNVMVKSENQLLISKTVS